jgi:hypothetical protein
MSFRAAPQNVKRRIPIGGRRAAAHPLKIAQVPEVSMFFAMAHVSL